MYVKVKITQEREVIDSPLALGWIISVNLLTKWALTGIKDKMVLKQCSEMMS